MIVGKRSVINYCNRCTSKRIKQAYLLFQGSSGDFDWDATVQGWILGGFSIGYITTQIVGGMLTEKYGGKWFFGGGIFLASVLGLLSPIAAKTSPYLLVTVRALQGAFIGPLFPSLLCMGSRWFPLQEKNKLMTFVQAGKQVPYSKRFKLKWVSLI